jgi:hypothetical protein
MVSIYFISALILFVVSFLVEWVIVSLILWKLNRKVFGIVFLINLFTWPIANFFYGIGLNLLVIEVAVTILEAILLVILLRVKYLRAAITSLVANVVSTLLGYIFILGSTVYY